MQLLLYILEANYKSKHDERFCRLGLFCYLLLLLMFEISAVLLCYCAQKQLNFLALVSQPFSYLVCGLIHSGISLLRLGIISVLIWVLCPHYPVQSSEASPGISKSVHFWWEPLKLCMSCRKSALLAISSSSHPSSV